jgi:hypothetical protein
LSIKLVVLCLGNAKLNMLQESVTLVERNDVPSFKDIWGLICAPSAGVVNTKT